MKNILSFLFLFSTTSFFAQMENPVEWSWESKQIDETTYELKFKAEIASGWTLYSQFTSDEGPVPTNFEFESGDHFELLGKAVEKGKLKEGMDPIFGVNVIKFTKGPAYFTQQVKVNDPSKAITGYLTFMCCDDEQCLPPTDIDFSFALSNQAQANAPTSNQALVAYPLEDIKIDRAGDALECGTAIASVNEESSLGWVFIAGFL
ncbi:MAG: thiol:disulfide interchange protein, partial [Bacteroidota bacterium]